ncbi:phage tail protein I [Acinetobacter sp. BWR-L5]|uniref:phage tail protein I n=1 Tax=Acinetobacter sp. BWR-L5 TaxID=2815725 RepID=UPI0031FE4600
MATLLPPNSTTLERHVCHAASNAIELEVNIKSIATLKNLPNDFLPLIAWQNSVDRWNRNWSEEQKIAQIKASFEIHKYKGTNYALRKIVEAFGYNVTIYEWWQEVPISEPGTFQILIDTNNQVLTEQGLKVLLQLIDDAKPLTRHCKNIQINVQPSIANYHALAACYSGDETTIYPEIPVISILPSIFWAFYEHQTTEIYPFGVTL